MNGYLYVGGSFTLINGITCSNFAVISLATGNLTGYLPLFDGNISSIACCSGGLLVIGGGFSHVTARFVTIINGVQEGDVFVAPVSCDSLVIMNTNISSNSGAGNLFNAFVGAFNALGITDKTSTYAGPGNPQASISKIRYHANSGYVFVGGQFWLSDGINIRQGLLAFNPSTNTLAPFNNLTNVQSFYYWDIDQASNKLYYSNVGVPPYLTSAWDLSNAPTITAYNWTPHVNFTHLPPSIFCANGKVFLGSINGSDQSLCTDASGNQYFGAVAVDGVTAILDGVNWGFSKEAFDGDTDLFSVVYNNGLYYLMGAWTHVLPPTTGLSYKSPRPSLMVRDSTNGYAFVGDYISFQGPTIIHYIPPSVFETNEPSSIYTSVLDGNELHLFGSFPWVDGQPVGVHYIMHADGTKIQQRYLCSSNGTILLSQG